MPLLAPEVSLLRSAARLLGRNFSIERGGAVATNAKKNIVSSSSVEDADLKEYISSLKSSPPSGFNVFKAGEGSGSNIETQSRVSSSTPAATNSLVDIFSNSLKSDPQYDDGKSASQLSGRAANFLRDELSAIFFNETHQQLNAECKVDDSLGIVLDLPSLSGFSNSDFSLRRRRNFSLEKKKWVFSKQEQSGRFNHLIRMCAKTFGSDAMLDVFGRLGQETGLKEFAALINTCIETAENSSDEDIALEQIHKAYQICKVVKDTGFEISEEMYGQILLYLTDHSMVEEFFLFHESIKSQFLGSFPRLAYYEMLLWIKEKNETKIQELCHCAMSDDSSENVCLRESVILALAESNRNQEFLMLLGRLEITRITSLARLKCIFKALGNAMLESYLERFLLELKSCGTDAETISSCIYQYTIGMPDVVDEDDVANKFQALHAMLDILPTASRYEMLIRFFCELLKVYAAIRILDLAHDSGVTLTLKTFHMILDACDQSCNFNLVYQIIPKFDTHGVQPDLEAFRRATLLYVRMKDFEGAYQMIEELHRLDLKPSASIYNIILGGYFREKKIEAAMRIIKQMEDAEVKPDAVTYSYVITHCNSEEGIIKYCDNLDEGSGVPLTKHVFMALINAYASSGQIGKAKEVILDKRISGKDLNDIKNVLVAALASNGQLSAALDLYEEIKRDKCHIDSKTIKCLIENFDSEEKLKDSLRLLEELNESPYWMCAWFSIMSLCLRYENLSCAVELLNQMKNKFIGAGVYTESLFDEVFCMYAEKEPKNVDFGVSLLEAVKKTMNAPQVTRKGLDFLLSACVRAKDSATASLIWKEYEAANLPYNVLTFLRMYQALLGSADKESAAKLLKKIPKDDPHVVLVLEACRVAYATETEAPPKPNMVEMKKKKKKEMKKKRRALVATMRALHSIESKIKLRKPRVQD